MTWRLTRAAKLRLLSLIMDPYLVGIVLLSSFLRIIDLSRKSIWLDEAYSLTFSQLSLREIFFLEQDTPPLYYMMLHYWLPVVGNSEFSIRLPSALFGVASVIAIYKLGRKLFDIDVGRMSALLVAISVFHVRYAQEARTYTLTVFLTIMSMYCFVDLIRRVNLRTAFPYIVFSVLLIYSHVYGLFVIVAQNAFFAVARYLSTQATRSAFRAWICVQLIVLAAFSPWILNLAIMAIQVQTGFWIPPVGLRDIVSSFITYSSGSKGLLLLLLALAAYSLVSIEKTRGTITWRSLLTSLGGYQWAVTLRHIEVSCFLLLWLLTPILVPFTISQGLQSIYVTRYTIVASLAFFILAARGINAIQSTRVRAITLGVVLALSLPQLVGYYTTSQKEEWREVAKYIDALAKEGDLVLFDATDGMLPFNYYSRQEGIAKHGVSGVEKKNIDAYWELVERTNRIWLISSHRGKNHDMILSRLHKSFDLLSYTEYYDVEVRLFGRKAP